jgi:hypothetical protein
MVLEAAATDPTTTVYAIQHTRHMVLGGTVGTVSSLQ